MDNMCIVERHARPHQSVLFMSDLNCQHELMITTTCIDMMITCQKWPSVEVRKERSKCKYRDLSSYNSLQTTSSDSMFHGCLLTVATMLLGVCVIDAFYIFDLLVVDYVASDRDLMKCSSSLHVDLVDIGASDHLLLWAELGKVRKAKKLIVKNQLYINGE